MYNKPSGSQVSPSYDLSECSCSGEARVCSLACVRGVLSVIRLYLAEIYSLVLCWWEKVQVRNAAMMIGYAVLRAADAMVMKVRRFSQPPGSHYLEHLLSPRGPLRSSRGF
ncbi:hypothetical protein J6590_022290 [Homalodisca vitripennis]|nr:hypothetical protein J6590_022290 [Homalodisca vitripennis]